MITPQQFRNPHVKPRWQASAGIMESVVAFNCRKYGMPRPVLAMPMWEGAGNRALDYSGHGNHGTLEGAKWDADKIIFTAAVNDYINVGSQINMASWQALSVTLMVNYDSSGIEEHTLISNWVPDSTSYAQILFRIEPSNDTLEGFVVVEANNQIGGSFLDMIVTPNQPNNIVFTYDTINGLQAYINDKKSSTSYASDAGLDTDSSQDMHIGGTPHRVNFDHLNGSTHNVGVYDVALSTAQVKFIHDNPYFMYEIPEELYGYAAAVAAEANPYWYYQMLRRR